MTKPSREVTADPELRREHDRLPAEPELGALQLWLRRHGIDPKTVLIDFIERRPERRQVVYRTPARRCSGCGTPLVHVEQLEGVPLPFPVPPTTATEGQAIRA